MNWRWSALDRYRLVSNSDAHSPGNLGREANLLDAEPSWQGVVGALRTGTGFLGTIEFFPEEGKYHFDGHRSCGVCMDPEETARAGGTCPVCGKPLTVGVLNRVLALADRKEPVQPRASEGFRSLIPLPELLSELLGWARAPGPWDGAVRADHRRIRERVRVPPGCGSRRHRQIAGRPSRGSRAADAGRERRSPARLRRRVRRHTGVRRRGAGEAQGTGSALSAACPRGKKAPRAASSPRAATVPAARAAPSPAESPGSLDPEQEEIVASAPGRGLVFAGPGTGKTRLLAAWIAGKARSAADRQGEILALTFTNKAAAELRDRLAILAPGSARGILATTFHSFAWMLLREKDPSLLTVSAAADRAELLGPLMPALSRSRLKSLGERMERCWEGMEEPDEELRIAMDLFEVELHRIGSADISAMVSGAVDLLRADDALLARVRARFPTIAVDELQDINRPQYDPADAPL